MCLQSFALPIELRSGVGRPTIYTWMKFSEILRGPGGVRTHSLGMAPGRNEFPPRSPTRYPISPQGLLSARLELAASGTHRRRALGPLLIRPTL